MKLVFKIAFLLSLAVIVPQRVAFAQTEPVHQTVIEPHASAGTLIAAVLETAGYEALSIVLEDLNSTFAALGSLIFIVVMLIGLYRLAVGDDLKGAAWMLIGPPTFYFLINAQVLASGATWQFGSFDGTEQVEVVLGETEETASKVPWLFHRFNLLLSSSLQELIKIVTAYEQEDQLRFMARPHLSDYLTTAKIGSPELTSLIQFSFAQCADSLDQVAGLIGNVGKSSSAKDIELVNPTSSQRTNLAMAQKGLDARNVTIGNGPWREALLSTMQSLNSDRNDGVGARWDQLRPYHSCLNEYVYSQGSDPDQIFASESVVSCNTLWCMVGVAANYEAQDVVKRGVDQNVPPEASDQLLTSIVNDVRKKLTHDVTSQDKSLSEATGELQYIISGLLLKKFMQSQDHTTFLGRLSERWNYRTSDADNKNKMSRESQMNLAREYNMEQLSEREKIQMYVFTQLLPYMQGIILYVLAISYPFFALFVLIPEKATTFLVWFAAWTWAKSWDLGWAVVMVIENLIWEFMPLDTVTGNMDNFSAVTMIDQAYTSNHTNSLATYYVIISMMLGAVPMITAKVLLGSNAAMGQTLVNGLQKVTNNMGEKVSRRKAIQQLRTVTSQKAQGMREFMAQGVGAALFGSYEQGVIKDQHGNVIPTDSQLGQAIKNLYANTQFGAARANIEQTLSASKRGFDASRSGMFATGLGALATKNPVTNLMAWTGIIPAANSANSSFVDIHRSAMNAQYKLAESVNDYMTYEYGMTKDFRYFENIRGAITDRGEFFTMPDAPIGALTAIDNLAQSSRAALVGTYGMMTGAGAGMMNSAYGAVNGARE